MPNNANIPIFFSADDNYMPLLEVAVKSIKDNSSDNHVYDLYILNTGLKDCNKELLRGYEKKNIRFYFTDVSSEIDSINNEDNLRLRDYYSKTIYYRLFIPKLFPEIKKAIYLDADVVLVEDIANLYDIDLSDNMVGAVMDEVVANEQSFRDYSRVSLGLRDYTRYFNSGVLLMNLEELRKVELEKTFFFVFNQYDFKTIAPDQDFLNVICKDKVLYLDAGWDKMPIENPEFNEKDLHLIHYNMFEKPCYYNNILYEEYFWKCAKDTSAYNKLIERRDNYSDEEMKNDQLGRVNLIKLSDEINASGKSLKYAFEEMKMMNGLN